MFADSVNKSLKILFGASISEPLLQDASSLFLQATDGAAVSVQNSFTPTAQGAAVSVQNSFTPTAQGAAGVSPVLRHPGHRAQRAPPLDQRSLEAA